MWTTLLIGGHSGSGKTTTARQLAQIVDAEVWALDELATDDVHQSERLLGQAAHWDELAEDIVRVLCRAGEEFAPVLEAFVHRAQNVGERIIIEGERVTPTAAAGLVRSVGPSLRALFLVEPDGEVIRDNLRRTSRNFRLLSPPQQENVIRVEQLYGLKLAKEARAYHLPMISPSPWTTLFARASRAALAVPGGPLA